MNKKIFTLFLFLIPAMCLFAQNTDTLSYTMVYNDFKSGLTNLSETVRSTASNVFDMLCWKYRIHGIINSILSVLTLGLSAWYLMYSVKTIDKDYENDNENLSFTKLLSSGVLCLIFGINFIFGMTDYLTDAFLPEYSAIKEIISYIK